MYKIKEIFHTERESYEQLGTKEKFWLNNRKLLFKSGRLNTLEDCSEKIASEIAKLIELPCAEYDFGKFIDPQNQTRFGIISKSFINHENNETLILGNQILGKLDKNYDQSSRYKAQKYTPTLVLLVFKALSRTMGDDTFLQTFIGYLVFDCLIGNTDRHHENWGIITNGGIKIASTFDHASGLASKVSEEDAQERLRTKDTQRNVEQFCHRARSAFYHENKTRLTTMGVCQEVKKFGNSHVEASKALKMWIDKIAQIRPEEFEKILDSVPTKEIKLQEAQKEFISKVLKINTNRLKDLVKG